MRLTKLLLEDLPRHYRFIRYGQQKWRDYQTRHYEPPYWYKWTAASPYSPEEQMKIRQGDSLQWYRHNIHKLPVVDTDKWLYRIGDRVHILTGKDKGKIGTIKKVYPEGNIIVVGGRNCKVEYSDDNGYQKTEQPLRHHEVALLDPKDNQPVDDVEFRVNGDGYKVRVSTRSGHIIYWPSEYLPDGSEKDSYLSGEKDTGYEEAMRVTYTPSLDDWEEELAKHYKVEDEKPRIKTFFY